MEVGAAVTVAVAVAVAVEAALVWAETEARFPRAQAVVNRVTSFVFIIDWLIFADPAVGPSPHAGLIAVQRCSSVVSRRS
ncbi:MAG: hypothetical protein DME25_11415 [Verrucomicrobia bacterium]|nr:MAG: hypothetical protein DME25_11415 [Verrucomicrobiota bacterium]